MEASEKFSAELGTIVAGRPAEAFGVPRATLYRFAGNDLGPSRRSGSVRIGR